MPFSLFCADLFGVECAVPLVTGFELELIKLIFGGCGWIPKLSVESLYTTLLPGLDPTKYMYILDSDLVWWIRLILIQD